MSGVVNSAPVGVPSNPAAVATPLAQPAAALPPGGAGEPATTPAPTQVATPAAVEPPAPAEAPAAGSKPDGNLLADALNTEGAETTAGDNSTPGEEPPAIKPEDYTFELSEGLVGDDPLITAFREGAAKNGVSQETAQALVSELGPKIAEQLLAPARAWEAMQADWQKQTREHPDIGGAKLTETLDRVTNCLRQFGHPDLPQALTLSGLGNNPALIWTINNLASRLMEGAPVNGGVPANTGSGQSGASKLYTSTSDAAAPAS